MLKPDDLKVYHIFLEDGTTVVGSLGSLEVGDLFYVTDPDGSNRSHVYVANGLPCVEVELVDPQPEGHVVTEDSGDPQ